MKGTGSTASSLMPSIQIFLVDPISGHRMEVPLDTHLSREDSIKFITPDVHHMENMTDLWFSVVVYKREGKDLVAAEMPGDRTLLRYRFSSGSTPRLAKVMPQSVGPGEVLTLQAWSCSGIVEAEPVQLVAIKDKTSDTSVVVDAGGEDIVADPEAAWGHIMEPFPPFESRHMIDDTDTAPEVENTCGGFGKLGSPGVDT